MVDRLYTADELCYNSMYNETFQWKVSICKNMIKEERQMSEKKIVSIEDRIPRLKQQRKKKANRRLIFYLSIFFILISIIVYLQSPFSNVETIDVSGNTLLTDEEIITLSDISTSTNMWSINGKKKRKQIEEHPAIEQAMVKRTFPRKVSIEVEELRHVGYVQEEDRTHPVLVNGRTLSSMEVALDGDAPLLVDFIDEDMLTRMAAELEQVPLSIYNLISEVHWVPEEDNAYKITLYMNDGFIVYGTIRNFAQKMEVYPSIISQLEPGVKGIIHVGVGAYFEAFDDE